MREGGCHLSLDGNHSEKDRWFLAEGAAQNIKFRKRAGNAAQAELLSGMHEVLRPNPSTKLTTVTMSLICGMEIGKNTKDKTSMCILGWPRTHHSLASPSLDLGS